MLLATCFTAADLTPIVCAIGAVISTERHTSATHTHAADLKLTLLFVRALIFVSSLCGWWIFRPFFDDMVSLSLFLHQL